MVETISTGAMAMADMASIEYHRQHVFQDMSNPQCSIGSSLSGCNFQNFDF